jgi:(p)ppGpp synthase/HD superfamily hydrolase
MKIDQKKIVDACFFASKVHKEQKYTGDELHIPHIENIVVEIMGVDSTLENPELAIICAILYKSIENTPTNYDDIKKKFGETVANGLIALTEDKTIPDKKARMIDSLNRIKQQPKEIWVVKMADIVANLGKLPHNWNLNKYLAYLEEAQIILDYLQQGNEIMANRLKKKIESYKGILNYYKNLLI